jgi:phosphatidate cytidylyltransferase
MVLLAMLIAGWEFYDMTRRAGHQPLMWWGLAIIAFIVIDAYFKTGWMREIILVALVISFLIGIYQHSAGWLLDWALTFAGVLYVGIIGAYFILVRELPNGMWYTLIAMLATWATDTGAYFAGTYLGRHGFFTSISPKKTWEGAIGGVLTATATVLVLGLFIDMPMVHRAAFGLGIGIAAVIGDLVESLLKRQTGVKDSSNLMPGHGGLLDRIDSLLFAAVFAYYYLVWILRV